MRILVHSVIPLAQKMFALLIGLYWYGYTNLSTFGYSALATVDFFLLAITLFFVEAVLIVKKSARRPSTILGALASFLRKTVFHGLAYLFGVAADVFGALHRMAIWIRDHFFGWIPKEVLLQAMHDLGKAFGALLRSPLGLFEGLWDAIAQSTIPLVTSVFFLVGTTITLVTLEVLFFAYGYETRPSTLLLATGALLTNGFYTFIVSFYHLVHLKELVVTIVHYMFGWLPRDKIYLAVRSLYHGVVALITSPRGVKEGLAFLQTNAGSYAWLLLTPLVLFMAHVIYRAVVKYGPRISAATEWMVMGPVRHGAQWNSARQAVDDDPDSASEADPVPPPPRGRRGTVGNRD